MPTLFNKYFRYVEFSNGEYLPNGNYKHGEKIIDKQVRGTIHSSSYKEQIPAITGSRNTGNVEVISSEQLQCRSRGGNDGGYVQFGSFWYQLISEQYYPHLSRISHYKYVGEMVPNEELPDGMLEATNQMEAEAV